MSCASLRAASNRLRYLNSRSGLVYRGQVRGSDIDHGIELDPFRRLPLCHFVQLSPRHGFPDDCDVHRARRVPLVTHTRVKRLVRKQDCGLHALLSITILWVSCQVAASQTIRPPLWNRTIYRRQDQGQWLGYLREFPDYWTQGESVGDLSQALEIFYSDSTSGGGSTSRLVLLRLSNEVLLRALVRGAQDECGPLHTSALEYPFASTELRSHQRLEAEGGRSYRTLDGLPMKC